MAVAVTSGPRGLFDPYTRDQSGLPGKIAKAVLGAGSAAQRATARAELFNQPDFTVEFSTDDADALSNCLKLSGTSSRGVTFPADTVRTIRMLMRSSNDADTFFQELEQDVYGDDGVTPVLGNVRLKRAFMLDAGVYKQMGDIVINSVVAVEGDESAPGSALAAYSSGYALTFPPSRVAIVKGIHVSQDTFEATTSAGHASIEALSASAGTGNVESYLTGAGTSVAIAAADLLQISMQLWPLAQAALVLNSTAVEVHARTTLADAFVHDLNVWVGKAISVALGA